jgi:hypothetical protein
MITVYLHRRNDTNEIFYVGIGKDEKRAYDAKNRKNKYWLNIVNKHGYSVEIIDYCETWEQACEMEKKLIKQYGRKDLNEGSLVNMTDGGDGQFNPSPETREKLRYPKTEEHKYKLRNYQLGVKQSEETIKKRLSHNFHQTDEYKEKMRIALSGDNNPMKKEENKAKLRVPKPKRTLAHSKKISESKKGKQTWNKNKTLPKFKCEICGKEIGGKSNLNQHIAKHNKL